MKPILMIDARNCMYRAIFAGKKDRVRLMMSNRPSQHYMLIWLKMMSKWINRFQPQAIQVFWDAPRNTVWRKKMYDDYKGKRQDNKHIEDISSDLSSLQESAIDLFSHMNVYQFSKNNMEADDLIYAACRLQSHQPTILVSTDTDMLQIPYYMEWVSVFNCDKDSEIPRPKYNPILQKALMGDSSDNISGYHGIGPKKSMRLCEDFSSLEEFLSKQERSVFIRNMLLVDLGLCPYLLHNQVYISKILADGVKFDKDKIRECELKHNLRGLMVNYNEMILPFKSLPVAKTSEASEA